MRRSPSSRRRKGRRRPTERGSGGGGGSSSAERGQRRLCGTVRLPPTAVVRVERPVGGGARGLRPAHRRRPRRGLPTPPPLRSRGLAADGCGTLPHPRGAATPAVDDQRPWRLGGVRRGAVCALVRLWLRGRERRRLAASMPIGLGSAASPDFGWLLPAVASVVTTSSAALGGDANPDDQPLT